MPFDRHRFHPSTDVDEELSAKKLRKLEKQSDTRSLDPWEHYRAMIDLYEAFFDMNELADRKTRFALVMMGALNALNLYNGLTAMTALSAIMVTVVAYFQMMG